MTMQKIKSFQFLVAGVNFLCQENNLHSEDEKSLHHVKNNTVNSANNFDNKQKSPAYSYNN